MCKVGDRVVVKIGSGDYYHAGDVCKLEHYDGDDWWGDFNENINVNGDGKWCVGKVNIDFEMIGD